MKLSYLKFLNPFIILTMALSKASNLRSEFSSIDEIDNEIATLKKKLTTLRLKKATRKTLNSHEFKFTRRKIAQLNLLKTESKFITNPN